MREYKDENGVYEVGIEVRHLRFRFRGVVEEVDLDAKTIKVKREGKKHALTVTAPGSFFETKLAEQRRNDEIFRRRGGSPPMENRDQGEEWSQPELDYLIKATAANVPDLDIAHELGRTREAVETRTTVLRAEGRIPPVARIRKVGVA